MSSIRKGSAPDFDNSSAWHSNMLETIVILRTAVFILWLSCIGTFIAPGVHRYPYSKGLAGPE